MEAAARRRTNRNDKQKPRQQKAKTKAATVAKTQLMLNTDLYAAEFHFGSPAFAQASSAPTEKVVADPDAAPERAQISTMRNYRVNLGSANLQIMRGEFHRHTEISGDGGDDGPIIDAYRYLIDAADMDWAGCCDHDNGGGPRVLLVDHPEADGRLSSRQTLRADVRVRAQRGVSRRAPQHGDGRRGVRPLPRLPLTDADAHARMRPTPRCCIAISSSSAGSWRRTRPAPTWGRTGATTIRRSSLWWRSTRATGRITRCRVRRARNRRRIRIGGWRPLGFVSLALQKGYRLGVPGVERSHVDAHVVLQPVGDVADARGHHGGVPQAAGLWATDNILADVRCGGHFMGEEFSVSSRRRFR